jgi:PAS domain S-box-containing protein
LVKSSAITCGDHDLLGHDNLEERGLTLVQYSTGLGTASEAQLALVVTASSSLPLDELSAITAMLGYAASFESLNGRAEKADALTKQRISEMAAVYELGREVAPADTGKLLRDITNRTAVLMEAAVCSVLLVDKQSGHLLLAANYGLPDDVPQQLQRVSEGVAGVVTQTRQPILIDPSHPDPRLSHIEISADKGPAIVVPMKDQLGEVIGVLAIRRATPGATFSHEDMQLISVFASQAALAILNARLYEDLERRAAELETLSNLSRALIQNTDLDLLLGNVVEEVCRTAGFRRCGVLMLDRARPVYVPRKWAGYGPGFQRLRARGSDDPLGLVASTSTARLFDCRTDSNFQFNTKLNLRIRGLARSLGVETFCVAPILDTEAKCVGIILADNRSSPDPISAEQFSLLSGFAGQVGVAVENSRLYYEMQNALETTKRVRLYTDKVLHSVGVAILSTDSEGKVIRWNPAAEQTLHLSGGIFHEALIENIVEKLDIWPEERAQVLKILGQVKRTGIGLPRTRLTLHTTRDEINIALFVTPLPTSAAERPGLVIIVEDLTQETRLQSELEKMQRLADIGQFAARMAHETRNALSPMRAAAQLMKRDLEAMHVNADWPDIIIEEVDNLARLTGEILDFARPGTLIFIILTSIVNFRLLSRSWRSYSSRTRLLWNGAWEIAYP